MYLVSFSNIANLATTQVEYLGHVISGKWVATNPKAIQAMVQWPIPKQCQYSGVSLELLVITGGLWRITQKIADPYMTCLEKILSSGLQLILKCSICSRPKTHYLPNIGSSWFLQILCSGGCLWHRYRSHSHAVRENTCLLHQMPWASSFCQVHLWGGYDNFGCIEEMETLSLGTGWL